MYSSRATQTQRRVGLSRPTDPFSQNVAFSNTNETNFCLTFQTQNNKAFSLYQTHLSDLSLALEIKTQLHQLFLVFFMHRPVFQLLAVLPLLPLPTRARNAPSYRRLTPLFFLSRKITLVLHKSTPNITNQSSTETLMGICDLAFLNLSSSS